MRQVITIEELENGLTRPRPRTARESQWKHRGIRMTEEKYTRLLTLQDNTCAICEAPPGARKLAVDHDHATGRIRGLLCFLCNYWLTRRGLTAQRLRRAADYLDGGP